MYLRSHPAYCQTRCSASRISCFKVAARGTQGGRLKPNPAFQRHCERRSVSPVVRASIGMFFRGARRAYGVVPCERERYSFSPGHWLPFARTDCWQARENGAYATFVVVDIVVENRRCSRSRYSSDCCRATEATTQTIPYPDEHPIQIQIPDLMLPASVCHCSITFDR